MRKRILSIGPTDLYLHLGTVAFAAYALLTGALPALLTSGVSLLLHECAHAGAAALLGQPPREIELTPLGAVLRLEDEERLPPPRRFLMLAAGPAMTLLLCALSLKLTAWGWIPPDAGRRFFAANLAILLINLLPALPLDGGRMLSLLLSCVLPARTVRRVLRVAGSLLGASAITGSLWLSWRFGGWNWSLAAVGCFLLYSASTALTTAAMAELRMLMDRKILLDRRGCMPLRQWSILADRPLHRAVRLLSPRCMTAFTILEPGSMRELCRLTESDLISAYLDHPDMSCLEAVRSAAQP